MEEYFQAMPLTPVEKILYSELQQQLISQDHQLLRNKTNGNDADRSKRMASLTDHSGCATEALIRRCSHFAQDPHTTHSNPTTLARILKQRQREFVYTRSDIRGKIRKAAWLNMRHRSYRNDTETYYKLFKERIRTDELGHEFCSSTVIELLADAEREAKHMDESEFYLMQKPAHRTKKPAEAFDVKAGDGQLPDRIICKSKDGKEYATALRGVVCEIGELANELVSRSRALHYIENSLVLQDALDRDDAALTCEACEAVCTAAHIISLGKCGHMICEACQQKIYDNDDICVVEGCTAEASKHVQSLAAEFKVTRAQLDTRYGAKLESILELITNNIPPEDQLLLFVQFEAQMNEISDILSKENIPHTLLNSALEKKKEQGRDAKAVRLDEFQKSTAKESKLLILLSADESAAGA